MILNSFSPLLDRVRILSVLMALALLPALSSCGNDDDPDPVPDPVQTENIFSGVTQTWPVSDPSQVYTGQRKSTYNFHLDTDTRKASLVIAQADFLAGMPDVGKMTFPGIDFVTSDNVVKLSCANLLPEIAGRPFSAFPISNLQAKLVPGRSLKMQFVCTYRGVPYMVVFDGTPVK